MPAYPRNGIRPIPTVAPLTPMLVTPEEAARMLRLSRSWMFVILKRGDIESVKIGNRRRIPIEALRAYIARQEAEQAGRGAGAPDGRA